MSTNQAKQEIEQAIAAAQAETSSQGVNLPGISIALNGAQIGSLIVFAAPPGAPITISVDPR